MSNAPSREDLIFVRWLHAGAPGGKPHTRRFAGRILSGAVQTRGGQLEITDRTARADFAELRRGLGDQRIHDDGSFGPGYDLELLLLDPAEASRFRNWAAAGCPGAGDRTHAAVRRARDRRSAPPAETADSIRRAWAQVRTFVRADGSLNRARFQSYAGTGADLLRPSDYRR